MGTGQTPRAKLVLDGAELLEAARDLLDQLVRIGKLVALAGAGRRSIPRQSTKAVGTVARRNLALMIMQPHTAEMNGCSGYSFIKFH
jgi:hypothetical protein